MALVINATQEEITVQVAGNYFNFKPGQRKTIRNESIARYIQLDRRGYGLAVLPDLTSQEEDDGDVEVSATDIAERKKARLDMEANACKLALDEFIRRKREQIKNAQVSLARDLQRKDYKHGPEHEFTDGDLEAMRMVAKYEKQGKDAAAERLAEIEKLKKQIG